LGSLQDEIGVPSINNRKTTSEPAPKHEYIAPIESMGYHISIIKTSHWELMNIIPI